MYTYFETELIAVVAVVAINSALNLFCGKRWSGDDKDAKRKKEGCNELHNGIIDTIICMC
jgi:hypothetical protein